VASAQIDWSELDRILAEADSRGGTVGASIFAPNGERFSRHGERKFRAASTIKIPVMIEIYRKIDRGEFSAEQVVALTAGDICPGSGILQDMHEGMELTIDDLISLMISISDNTATNMLIDLAGMDQVNATMRELGMTASELNRKMKGVPSPPGAPENWATPDDFARSIASILDGAAASAKSCERMITMLGRQDNERRIARYLPKTETIRWGSKTGTIGDATNDVGFVEADGRQLIMSFYGEGFLNMFFAEQAIGELSRAAMIATRLLEPLPVS
jgi:beta-lactamase class A